MIHIITSDQTDTVLIDGDRGDAWYLASTATINVAGVDGMREVSEPNTINVFGDIKVTGDTAAGVRFKGFSSTVNVGAFSMIDARDAQYGIEYEGINGFVIVRGTVWGGEASIHAGNAAVVENHGLLRGRNGIVFESNFAYITNFEAISVSGTGIRIGADSSYVLTDANSLIRAKDGIVISGNEGEKASVTNDGRIEATRAALVDGDDALRLLNNGTISGFMKLGGGDDFVDSHRATINGSVNLGAGNDYINVFHGKVEGKIFGGTGDDVYAIGVKSQQVYEGADQGIDTIKVERDYTLRANFENLILLGVWDANGVGNALDNEITGNSSENILSGGKGNDTLDGKSGDDTLKGGSGADTLHGGLGRDTLDGGSGADLFVFNAGDKRDTITAFTDKFDHIQSDLVQSRIDFETLNVKQVGADVLIDFGNGDSLRIENFSVSKFTYSDFDV